MKFMKEWKDGNNRFELRLDGKEACVLYYDENFGYYVRAYLDGGSFDGKITADDLVAAKHAAEKWYARLMRKRIEMHQQCISHYEKTLGFLAEN